MSLTIADSNDTNAFLQDQEKIGPFQRFFNKIVSGSYPLFLAAILAMIWANLLAASYHSFWHTQLSLSFGQFSISKSLVHWIDEALMTLFFFTVGLEIKREILVGGLSSVRQAALPIVAAVGGMLVPAVIFVHTQSLSRVVDFCKDVFMRNCPSGNRQSGKLIFTGELAESLAPFVSGSARASLL